jgi:hypothetical protein
MRPPVWGTSVFNRRTRLLAPFASVDAGSRLTLFPNAGILRVKCDGTCAETRFRLSAKRRSTFNRQGASVQSTTCSRGVRIRGSNTGYIMLRGSVKGTGYTFHSPVSPSLPLPYVTVCHHVSNGLYFFTRYRASHHTRTQSSYSLIQFFGTLPELVSQVTIYFSEGNRTVQSQKNFYLHFAKYATYQNTSQAIFL